MFGKLQILFLEVIVLGEITDMGNKEIVRILLGELAPHEITVVDAHLAVVDEFVVQLEKTHLAI